MAKNFKNGSINDESKVALENTLGADNKQEPEKVTSGPCQKKNVGEMKDETTPKAVFNTKKAATLVGNGSQSSSGVGGALMFASRQVSYSGGGDAIGGDKSSTLVSDKPSRSGNRPGKQIDSALMHIDDAPAEVFEVPLETIPMITEGNANVGYNGKYRNAHQISQKGAGGSPADADFFRTLDVVEYDNVYYADGQYITSKDDSEYKDLTISDGKTGTATYSLANYLYKTMQVKFEKDTAGQWKVSDLKFLYDDITPEKVGESIYRVANDNKLRLLNSIELDRLAMIEKAGDETKDNFSALGRVIRYGRNTNLALKQMDNSIGDICFLSQTKLAHALAYQNNKAAKDGLRKVGPMFEMAWGNVNSTASAPVSVRRTYFADTFKPAGDLFKKAASGVYDDPIMNGSAALYIAMHDSTTKYNTKGKMLSLPLSYKVAISTARKNFGEMRCHTTFINELNRQEVFGKIDEDGSGMTPVFLSDGAKVAIPFDLNTGVTVDNGFAVVNDYFYVHYEDLRNVYDVPVYNYFAKGMLAYLNRYAHKIAELGAANSGVVTLKVPMTSTTGSISLWDLFVCDAAKDIAIERKYAMDIVLAYEDNNGYPYSGSIKIHEANPEHLAGIGYSDITDTLRTSNIGLNVGARILMPEIFTQIGYVDLVNSLTEHVAGSKVLLPWYFNQNQFIPVDGTNDATYWEYDADNMSSNTYFDFRGGVTFGNADRIKAMDPEQLRLCMDRMVALPADDKQITDKDLAHAEVWKYAFHEDGIPVVNYIGFSDKTGVSHLSIKDILITPRELGLSAIAPAGLCTPTMHYSSGNLAYYQAYNDTLTAAYLTTSGPSFRLRSWRSKDVAANTILSAADPVTRLAATNFMAGYHLIEATPLFGDDAKFGQDTDMGLVISATRKNGNSNYTEYQIPLAVVDSAVTYDPDTASYNASEHKVVPGTTDGYASAYTGFQSALKALYTRVQLWPFVINPFDANNFSQLADKSVVTNSTWYVTTEVDPFDFLHLFNMCGFRCGEYSGTEFDRNKARIESGLGYVADPYMERRL